MKVKLTIEGLEPHKLRDDLVVRGWGRGRGGILHEEHGMRPVTSHPPLRAEVSERGAVLHGLWPGPAPPIQYTCSAHACNAFVSGRVVAYKFV